jgi:adenosylhomocysteine nucleosidase
MVRSRLPIAIVAAMREELAGVLARMPGERHVVAGRAFWVGRLYGQDVVAALSGMGKVAAATTAAVLVERFRVGRVVFTGVAGGLAPGVRVGDVVLARSFVQHDVDASPLFPRHEVPGYGRARFAADALLTDALELACARVLQALPQRLGADTVAAYGLHGPRLHQGLLASGDRFVASAADSQALRQALPDALAVEMEGAAFAQVCHDFGVPLAVVRTISDGADDSAAIDFPRFLRDVASRYSAAIVEELLR